MSIQPTPQNLERERRGVGTASAHCLLSGNYMLFFCFCAKVSPLFLSSSYIHFAYGTLQKILNSCGGSYQSRHFRPSCGGSALEQPLFGGHTASAEPLKSFKKTPFSTILKLSTCWDQNASNTDGRSLLSLSTVSRRASPLGQPIFKFVNVFVRYCRKYLKNARFLAIFCEILVHFCGFWANQCDTDYPVRMQCHEPDQHVCIAGQTLTWERLIDSSHYRGK